MVPLAEVARASDLLRDMDQCGDIDCKTHDVVDFAEVISQDGTPEERVEALLVLTPMMQNSGIGCRKPTPT